MTIKHCHIRQQVCSLLFDDELKTICIWLVWSTIQYIIEVNDCLFPVNPCSQKQPCMGNQQNAQTHHLSTLPKWGVTERSKPCAPLLRIVLLYDHVLCRYLACLYTDGGIGFVPISFHLFLFIPAIAENEQTPSPSSDQATRWLIVWLLIAD